MQFNFEEDIKKTIKSASRHKVGLYFSSGSSESLSIEEKKDQSIVTDFDLSISNEIKNWKESNINLKNWTFFSEEDHSELLFPAIVLDPIDGTRELVKGRPECAVSLALMRSSRIDDPENYAWLFNPFSGFSLDTTMLFVPSLNRSSQKSLALVSRSEFHKGLFDKFLQQSQIEISPRGSIAFKLGLLASGACDFVISLAPKNVWDIAAGTILCHQRGIYFYQNGIRINKLDKMSYEGVLIWTTEAQFSMLQSLLGDEILKMK